MNSKTTILIADDHLVVRMGLATIIGLEKDLIVAGEAKDGAEAVRLAGELKPDVIVMDLMMPRLDGAEATAKILAADPSAKILILTTFSSSEGVKAALDAGAVGAIVKDSSDAELLAAMRAAAAGRRTVSREIRRHLSVAESAPSLSRRQTEILLYVAKGMTTDEISKMLGIGPDCVKAHLRTACSLLDASSRSEAAAIAVAKGLIAI